MQQLNKIVLTIPERADIPAIYELLRDGQVAPTTSTIPRQYKMADAERWFGIVTSTHDNLAIERVIRLRNANKVIGIISCKKTTAGTGNVAYWIGAEYWNQGICTSALALMIQILREKSLYKTIEGHHISINVQSGKVLLKNNFIWQKQYTSFFRDEETLMESYKLIL